MYIFLNLDKASVEKDINIEEITLLSKEEFDTLYEERNIHEGNEREQMYGKLHENWLKIWDNDTSYKTGKWTKDFCRDFATLKAQLEVVSYAQSLGIQEWPKVVPNELREKFIEVHISGDSTYSQYCDKMFDETITDEEMQEILQEYKNLPEEFKFLEDKEITEEMKYYLQEKE